MNVRKLMQQAQKMQEQMQRDLGELEISTSVGGGMVQVKMNGHKQLLAVTVDPEAIDDADTSILEDLILAAVNEASRQVDEAMQEKMGGMAGALGGGLGGGLPGF